jgi:hypothetical protein
MSSSLFCLATIKTAWKIHNPIILTRLDVVGLFLLAVFPGRRLGRKIALALEGLAGVDFLWQAGLFCLIIWDFKDFRAVYEIV